MLISKEYRALNAELHATSGSYGTSGHKWAGKVLSLARQCEAKSILDYGSGKGSLKQAFDRLVCQDMERLGYQDAVDWRDHVTSDDYPYVIEYDPAIEGKEEKPARADLVVCGDVLEHIEPDCLYAVLDDIRSIARVAVFLVVATQPAAKFLSDGRNAHLIVEPADWWLPKLMMRWRVALFRDLGGEFLAIGVPR